MNPRSFTGTGTGGKDVAGKTGEIAISLMQTICMEYPATREVFGSLMIGALSEPETSGLSAPAQVIKKESAGQPRPVRTSRTSSPHQSTPSRSPALPRPRCRRSAPG